MTAPAAAPSSSSAAHQRRSFHICCGKRFSIDSRNVLDCLLEGCTMMVEKFVLVLGPLLIIFASMIISGLSWTFFTIYLPMLQLQYHHHHKDTSSSSSYYYGSLVIGMHISFVLFLIVQITFNYFMCVTTSNKGQSYDQVVRELAVATDFDYPETPQDVELFRRDFEDRMLLRMKRRQIRAFEEREKNLLNQAAAITAGVAAGGLGAGLGAGAGATKKKSHNSAPMTLDVPPPVAAPSSANVAVGGNGMTQRKNSTTTAKKQPFPRPKIQPTPAQVRDWMIMAPDEWGYCQRSKQPKPPRSHYDHVSKTLVLCLDHYCPWMFNAVGYFNYRYFCNFLWFVELAMIYGASITYVPFTNISGPLYKRQLQEFRKTGVWKHLYPMVPIGKERMPISLAFMLCLAIGIAVACLGGFHLYLCLTGQTTIEFHGNWVNKRKAAKLNKKFKSPYDVGYLRNWQQVYGSSLPWWKALLVPSAREPEYLPLPLPGDDGKRKRYQSKTRPPMDEIRTPLVDVV